MIVSFWIGVEPIIHGQLRESEASISRGWTIGGLVLFLVVVGYSFDLCFVNNRLLDLVQLFSFPDMTF